jgi:PAS domain S-box-containing protein
VIAGGTILFCDNTGPMPVTNTPARTLTDLLFEDAVVGRCLIAPDETILRANSEWLRSTGFTEEQVVGESIIDLFPGTRDMTLALHARARAGHRVEVPRHAQVVNGRETWWEGSIAPVPMEGGMGLLMTAREVSSLGPGGSRESTDQQHIEEAFRRTDATLQHAGAMAHLGAWWIEISNARDLSANPLRWSDEVYRIFGYAPGEVEASNALFFDHVHPEDRQRIIDAVAQALATRQPYVVEHRVLPRGGAEREVLEYGSFEFDDTGRPVRLVGAVQDVSERKRAEEAQREAEARYRTLFDSIDEGFCVVEVRFDDAGRPADYRFLEVNPAFEKQTGLVDAAGKWMRALAPDHEEHWFEIYGKIALTGEPQRFVNEAKALHRWYDVYAFRTGDPLRRRVAILFNDITARKRAEQELREADRRKDEFLGMLSHELRNPLAPIRNSAYILRHAQPGSEPARRAQTVIERQTEHLTRLVDDLLDVTRIARGKIELRRERVDLRDVVSRAADDFRLQMRDRGIRFDVVVPGEQLWADADATRITQAVGNLLHNASKFTRSGGEVVLLLGASAGDAEIRVRDTGAGIDVALLPRVFEVFVQGERTLARTEGGLGLGLALVKGIAELHGGTARAESAGNGQGAEFIVRLPLVEPVLARPDIPVGTQPSTGSRRVLVVDDNPDAAESLADVVRMLGHDVEVAYDGPSAIDKARANAPHVVLCDLGLPGMTGYEVAKALRATFADGMQLFAVSGYARPEDVKRALEAGFEAHVAKPLDIAQIERLVS